MKNVWQIKSFSERLLLSDEQESQIDKYLERGELFSLYNVHKSVCAVTGEGGGKFIILIYKNFSYKGVVAQWQKPS